MSCPRYAPLSLAQSFSSHPCTLPAVLLATMSPPSKLSTRAELCYITYLLRCRIYPCASLLALPALSLAVSLQPRCSFAALSALELNFSVCSLPSCAALARSAAPPPGPCLPGGIPVESVSSHSCLVPASPPASPAAPAVSLSPLVLGSNTVLFPFFCTRI